MASRFAPPRATHRIHPPIHPSVHHSEGGIHSCACCASLPHSIICPTVVHPSLPPIPSTPLSPSLTLCLPPVRSSASLPLGTVAFWSSEREASSSPRSANNTPSTARFRSGSTWGMTQHWLWYADTRAGTQAGRRAGGQAGGWVGVWAEGQESR